MTSKHVQPTRVSLATYCCTDHLEMRRRKQDIKLPVTWLPITKFLTSTSLVLFSPSWVCPVRLFNTGINSNRCRCYLFASRATVDTRANAILITSLCFHNTHKKELHGRYQNVKPSNHRFRLSISFAAYELHAARYDARPHYRLKGISTAEPLSYILTVCHGEGLNPFAIDISKR